jgi:hypothetical protein
MATLTLVCSGATWCCFGMMASPDRARTWQVQATALWHRWAAAAGPTTKASAADTWADLGACGGWGGGDLLSPGRARAHSVPRLWTRTVHFADHLGLHGDDGLAHVTLLTAALAAARKLPLAVPGPHALWSNSTGRRWLRLKPLNGRLWVWLGP